jgi:hypothetical protein
MIFNTPSACGGVSTNSLSLRERVRVRGNKKTNSFYIPRLLAAGRFIKTFNYSL